jgi:uncharacterized protein YodC (DUF2158 family)
MVCVVRISPDDARSTYSQTLAERTASEIAAIPVRYGATDMSFKVGDTVRLKSGSPLMTVIKLPPVDVSEPNIACTWFSDDEQPHNGEFPEAALEIEEAETEEEDEEERDDEERDHEEHDEDEEDEDEDEDEEKDEEKKGKRKKDK